MSSISENFDCPHVSSDITRVKCQIQKNKPQAVRFIRKKQKHMCQLKNLKDPLGLQGVNKIHWNHRRERLALWKKTIGIYMTPKLKMDYYHHQKSTYLEQPNFQMSGQKLDKKVDPLQRGSLEEFEYSLFSSKTYSILSYIVGGFVGSKSQMNNNKHNLSYDLSAAIFNLLNPSKYERDKWFLRKNNENNFVSAASKNYSECYEKYYVNRSSHKEEEELKNCLADVMNLKWLSDFPLLGSESYVEAFNKPNDSVLNEKENISCDEKDGVKNTAIKIIPCNSPIKVESKIIVHLNEEPTQCKSENDFSQNSSLPKDNESVINNTSSSSCDCVDYLDTEVTVTDLACPNSYPSITSIVKERFRQQSECSVESTDSESFIVFDDFLDVEDERKEKGLDVDNDDFDSEDEDESSCDEYDIYSPDNELEEINNKWLISYQNDEEKDNEVQRKVKFSDDVKINKIVAWDYAYRAARPGPWEQMARDRCRFRERIFRLSSTISPVLRPEHREKIYKKLYS